MTELILFPIYKFRSYCFPLRLPVLKIVNIFRFRYFPRVRKFKFLRHLNEKMRKSLSNFCFKVHLVLNGCIILKKHRRENQFPCVAAACLWNWKSLSFRLECGTKKVKDFRSAWWDGAWSRSFQARQVASRVIIFRVIQRVFVCKKMF